MLTIRPLRDSDLPEVLRIESLAFSHPWPPEAFTATDNEFSYVLCEDQELRGYIMYHAVLDEGVIINFAIDPAYQHQGHGTRLLQDTLEQMIEHRIHRFFLDVRASNLAAQKLYRRFGFHRLGTRKNYYSQPEEDSIVMVKHVHEQ